MVNNISEKLIKFPVSEWIVQSSNFKTDLPSSAYCICYQYNIDNHGYGPYGFSTKKAERLLPFLFSGILFFNKQKKTLDVCSTLRESGIYFYGNGSDRMDIQLREYNKILLKKKLRANKGVSEEIYTEKPKLLNLYNDGKIETSIVNYFIEEDFSFLFNCFFTPVAGQSLILFDHKIWNRAIEYCKSNELYFQEVDSIDNLKEW